MYGELNKEQYEASRYTRGVSLVIAGAGTGKTRVLIEKVKNIILSGHCASHHILLLTFSRKAADELKDRIMRDVGSGGAGITTGTFHSFCFSLLQQGVSLQGKPKVLDSEGSVGYIDGILDMYLYHCKGIPLSVMREGVMRFSKLNEKLKLKLAKTGIKDIIDRVHEDYVTLKEVHNYIDFDDMLDRVISVLERDDVLKKRINDVYRYILVDEFQDTSEKNFRLLKLLLHDTQNFFAVIYRSQSTQTPPKHRNIQ